MTANSRPRRSCRLSNLRRVSKHTSPATVPSRRIPRPRTAPPKRRLQVFAILPYEYTALNREASEIRLMTLLPGSFGSDVLITIQNVVHSKSRVPTYEALSYAWGLNDKCVHIRVKEPEEVRSLAVTSNLAEALQYLRYEQKSRTLWIDAICVDQQNIEERGHQVSRMADIYRLASPVVVWLGPESASSAKAMTELSALGSTIRVDWATSKVTPLSGEEYQAWRARPWLSDEENSESVKQLLDRLWFKRLWIWQEVRLARNGVEILCGDKTMQWETLRKAIWCLDLKRRPRNPKLYDLAFRVLNMCYYIGALSSLEYILHCTRYCNYSDPRDRIYAIMNLAHPWDVFGLEADYSKSTEEVFQNVVLSHLSTTGTLNLLRQCEISTIKAIKVPSWVPDWTVINGCIPLPGSKACWGSKAQTLFKDKGILEVIAHCLSTIDTILGLESEPFLEDNFANTLRKLVSDLRWNQWKDNAPTDDVSIMEALCRTLCCDRFAETCLPPSPGLPRFQESREYVFRVIKSNALPIYKPYYNLVNFLTEGRAFFTTVEGHIGLAPRGSTLGDQVCIVLGCQSPLVLRANEDGGHTVIGECYAHGVTDGAGLLGMLPRNWQRVDRYDPDVKYYCDAFIDHDTGSIQREDPRLGPLPPGWRSIIIRKVISTICIRMMTPESRRIWIHG